MEADSHKSRKPGRATNTNARILGHPVDGQTRCIHYQGPTDILAIRFRCCREYYPCFTCHEETAGHPAEVWSRQERKTRALLCGACRHEMTIDEYLLSEHSCPACGAGFNPGCSKHYHMYFEM